MPKVSAWRASLAARKSVREAVVADYPERLGRFLANLDAQLARIMQMHDAAPNRLACGA